MGKSNQERLRRLLDEALSLASQDREWLASQISREDYELGAELRRGLTDLPCASGSFLEPPFMHSVAPGDLRVEPGTSIGGFQILKEIGRGSTGIVLLAESLDGGGVVAIKFLPSPLALDSARRERFLCEARMAARLSHPAILAPLSHDHFGADHFIVMPFVDGHDLAVEIDLQRLVVEPGGDAPEGAVVSTALLPPFGTEMYFLAVAGLLSDCAEALAYAHDRGVAHGDVKPHNILLDRLGRPFLSDFGAYGGSPLPLGSAAEGRAGTPAYVCPEALVSTGTASSKLGDVYSLGAVIYEVLTLRRPYSGSSVPETIAASIAGPPLDLRQINPLAPSALVEICGRAMERDPQHRYPDLGALARDLRAYQLGEPIVAQGQVRGCWRRIRAFLKRLRG